MALGEKQIPKLVPRGALELIEYAFRTSATLADGMDRLTRYGRLVNDRLAVHVLDTGPGVRFLLGVADAAVASTARGIQHCAGLNGMVFSDADGARVCRPLTRHSAR